MSVISRGRMLATVLVTQALVIALLALDAAGVTVAPLSYIVGFVYLTFVPGMLILVNIRLDRIGLLEMLLFSVGLSLISTMLVGLLLQVTLPLLGMAEPLSTLPVAIGLGVFVIALSLVAYRRKRTLTLDVGRWPRVASVPALLLVLVVLLGVLGGNEMTASKTAGFSLAAVALIALIPILVILNRIITRNVYPWAILAIALSLLLIQTTRGTFLTGFLDVHMEAYFHQLTLANSSWDMTIAHDYNSMLSVGILPTLYALVARIPSNEIFRVVYPLIFALMPVALYAISARLWDGKTGFFAAFFFVATSSFYNELAFIPRQGYAELFLALWTLAMVHDGVPRFHKVLLSIVFGVGIATSHYGLSYVFMGSLVFTWLVLAGRRMLAGRRILGLGEPASAGVDSGSRDSAATVFTVVTGGFVLLFIVACLGWYLFVGQGKLFELMVNAGSHILGSINSELFNPATRPALVIRALGFGQMEPGILYWTYRITFYLTALFIVIGALQTFLRRREWQSKAEYLALSVAALGVLGMTVVLPYFGDYLNMPRFYHISLLFLAPFCVIGGRSAWGWLMGRFRGIRGLRPGPGLTISLVCATLVAYFVFQTGFPFVLAGIPSMNRFNIAAIEESGTAEDRATFYGSQGYIFLQDQTGLDWLMANRAEGARVFADITNSHKALASYGMIYEEVKDLYPDGTMPWVQAEVDYIYLSYTNVVTGFLSYLQTGTPNWTLYPLDTVEPLLRPSSRVYANGVTEIWLIGGAYPGSVWKPDEN